MPSKLCLFNRKLALNGRSCLPIDFSDDNFPLTLRFRTVDPQTPAPTEFRLLQYSDIYTAIFSTIVFSVVRRDRKL